MKLYMAHVGFYEKENGIYEIHCNLFVVAANLIEAALKIKENSRFQNKKMHIDGIEELVQVDGYDIHLNLSTTNHENKMYQYEEIKAVIKAQ